METENNSKQDTSFYGHEANPLSRTLRKKKGFDSLWIGTVAGLFSPWFTLYVFYLIKYNHISFADFFNNFILGYNILTPVISLCTIINLLVFFIFVWTNRNYSARGVLLATFIYAGYVVYQKYIK